ncbi:hypothetical protein BpHYR1_005487 [Brachionus plicatilis]|uniref:Uncharacterized protein n=1 Tax=Brachionus plicatilis TaxID=10195 RepID=A0A3M7PG47_BRAPC|nr:hypothetical protein BpHYR1_005487 [Brachionus plicatilis]
MEFLKDELRESEVESNLFFYVLFEQNCSQLHSPAQPLSGHAAAVDHRVKSTLYAIKKYHIKISKEKKTTLTKNFNIDNIFNIYTLLSYSLAGGRLRYSTV